jgi:peptidoglycan-associated lipoprotein
MRNTMKGFLAGLVVLTMLVAATSCRTSRKQNDVRTETAPTETAPTVTIPPNDTSNETRVETQPPDFVQETKPTEEVLPRDIERLNEFVRERGYVRDAFFGYDESALSDEARAALTASATWLRQNPQYNLLIEGHCDERGTEQYNLALGDRRAHIVREYLVTLGIDNARIKTVSYGEERPFEQGHDESAWAQNRRGHLVVVEAGR